MEPTAYHDQKQYLLTATKPFSMGCKQLSSRLTKIKTLMKNMPGASDAGNEIYSDLEFKMLFYNLMRTDWKTTFDASGNVITNADYPYSKLVAFMAAQERREVIVCGGHRGNRHVGRGAGRNCRGRPMMGRQQSYSGQSRPYYGLYGSPGRYTYTQRYPYDQAGPPSQQARYDFRAPSPRSYESPRGYTSRFLGRSHDGRSHFNRDGRSPRDGRFSSPRRLNFSPRGNRNAGRYRPQESSSTATGTFVTEEDKGQYQEHYNIQEEHEAHWAD